MKYIYIAIVLFFVILLPFAFASADVFGTPIVVTQTVSKYGEDSSRSVTYTDTGFIVHFNGSGTPGSNYSAGVLVSPFILPNSISNGSLNGLWSANFSQSAGSSCSYRAGWLQSNGSAGNQSYETKNSQNGIVATTTYNATNRRQDAVSYMNAGQVFGVLLASGTGCVATIEFTQLPKLVQTGFPILSTSPVGLLNFVPQYMATSTSSGGGDYTQQYNTLLIYIAFAFGFIVTILIFKNRV